MLHKQGWKHDNDWFVAERDIGGDQRDYLLVANADLDVSVFVEEWSTDDGYSVYGVGVHDRTIAAHPSIPGSVYEERSWWDGICRMLELARNVDEHIENMRNSDDYLRAIEVKEGAPPTREEGGVIPGFEVRNREGKVYEGRMSADEALAELRGSVLEKHEERNSNRANLGP